MKSSKKSAICLSEYISKYSLRTTPFKINKYVGGSLTYNLEKQYKYISWIEFDGSKMYKVWYDSDLFVKINGIYFNQHFMDLSKYRELKISLILNT